MVCEFAYFKNQEKSYIIFEGYDEKQGYFYMLLRRDGDGIKYYFVKKKFDRSMFMEYDDLTEEYTVFPFSRISENPSAGIGAPLKDHREVLAKAITSRKGEVAFLRLTNESKSRQFSDLYKHLFRSGSDDEILKNGILIVNGLKGETLDMRKELPLSQLAEWKKEQDEIDTLKEAQQYLADLKEKHNNVEARKVSLISELALFEEIDFNQVRQSVNSEDEEYQKQIKDIQRTMGSLKEERKAIRARISDLDRQEGKTQEKATQLRQNIKAIGEYPDWTWLKQDLYNNDEEYSDIRAMIKGIDAVPSVEIPKKKLQHLERTKKEIGQFVNNKENTLLMNLSDSKEEIGIIHAVLSDAVTTLPKSAILSDASPHQNGTFTYNGAKIDISSLDIKDIPTVEERKRELQEVEEEIEKTLAVIENFNKKEELEDTKKKIEDKIQKIKNQLSELSSLDTYHKNLTSTEQELIQIHEKRENEKQNEKSVAQREDQATQHIDRIEEKRKLLSTQIMQ